MIVTYAYGDQPPQCWDRTANPKMPGDLEYMLHDDDDVIWMHNAMFDRNVRAKENYDNLKTQCTYRAAEENVNVGNIRIHGGNGNFDHLHGGFCGKIDQ